MTTTTKTITISLIESEDETVNAEYYIIEDGWVTFKTSDHKAVAAYPERRVLRIKSAAESTPFVFHGGDNPLSAEQIAACHRRIADHIALGV